MGGIAVVKDRHRPANQVTPAIRKIQVGSLAVASSQLLEIGQQALAAVAGCAARGGPLLRCQLLASEFYEALRRELREPSKIELARRFILIAATHQCQRTATANSPAAMLADLKGAITILQFDDLPVTLETARSRPMLRVIEGGLSRSGN
jgi:hypothetical protein